MYVERLKIKLSIYFSGTFGTIVALSYVILVYDNPNTHPRISYEEKRYLNKFSTNHGSKDEVLFIRN